jgi:cytochrome c553
VSRVAQVGLVCALAVLLAAPAASGQAVDSSEAARIEFFEAKIRPLLAGHCYNCHSASTNSQGGLRVDDRNGLLVGGSRGPAVVPGDPEESLLLQAIRQTHAEVKMPPERRLTDEQIADVAQWIAEGAAWPAEHFDEVLGEPPAEYAAQRASHWAWQPLRRPGAPEVADTAWPRGAIDRFILSRLERQGLEPVADADPQALVRRLSFDLTGLPPTPEEAAEFVRACQSAGADGTAVEWVLARWVDRLLASPAFGERWGRHWLDVARYGESTGGSRNVPYPHAWRYRDYVIDALNGDKPFDQFLREQIAGDLLPAESQQQRDELAVATGFLALGVCDVNQRFKVRFVMDNVDEQIDTVGRAVLGLTVGCARCHDHKYEPIPTADYYALAGIFQSTDRCSAVRNKMGGGGLDYYDTAMLLPLGPPERDPRVAERREQARAVLAQARAELSTLESNLAGDASDPMQQQELDARRQRIAVLQQELLVLNDPAAQGPVALGARESADVGDAAIRIRGEAERLGPMVPRGFLSAVDVPGAPAVDPGASGRLELADWLASRHNPLTPRVAANRIWQRLLGRGLVASVDNFGVTGDAPSHPELLDYLATRLIEEDWSLKRLIRQIVLSRTYRLSADAPPANLAIDPDNRLVWRHAPRRLDAEEIRDAMLASSGRLDLDRPAGSWARDLPVVELNNVGPQAQKLEAYCLASRHRSVYLPVLRGLTPRPLAVFDFAEQGMVTGRRDETTVATQALYLLNDPFVVAQAQEFAKRLLTDESADDAGRIEWAYRIALGRPATSGELERTVRFLADYEAAARAESPTTDDPRPAAWGSFCQALLASAEFRYLR